jgi:hypothetical protein
MVKCVSIKLGHNGSKNPKKIIFWGRSYGREGNLRKTTLENQLESNIQIIF